jgi:cytochrome P450
MSTTPNTSSAAEAARERARTFYLFDPEMDEPYSAFDAFREHCPVAHSEPEGGYWILSKHQDIQKALANPKIFSTEQTTLPKFNDPLGKLIPLDYDPPEHRLYRHSLNGFFSASAVAEKEPQIRSFCRERLRAIVAESGADLVQAFCVPYPAAVFLLIFGAPVDDLEQMLEWKHQMLHEGLSGDPEKMAYVDNEIRPRVGEYWGALIEQRERDPDPPPDVLTGLTHAKVGDRPYTRNEQMRALSLLMTAGLDTVTSTLSMALWYLATHPAMRQKLAADESLVPSAVEEMLRYFAPVSTYRKCKADVEVRGTRIRAGDVVLMSLPSASRDEETFANAAEVDLERHPNRHLAFGAGPHRCLGSHLARLQLNVAFEELRLIMPEFELAPDAEVKWHWGQIYGIDRLDVVVPAA